jgi:hypothetical protein
MGILPLGAKCACDGGKHSRDEVMRRAVVIVEPEQVARCPAQAKSACKGRRPRQSPPACVAAGRQNPKQLL